jgi:serine/threonine protein kinase
MSEVSEEGTRVTVTAANKLLKEYFGDGEEWRVVDSILSGKDIFTTADNQKIIKFVDFSPEIENGIKLHEIYSKIGCNICKLLNYQIIEDQTKKIIIVMENCGKDLVNFLKDAISLMQLLQLSSELLKQIICLQTPADGGARGVHGVVHGDIKPENVTVQKNPNSSLNVRLIDFDGSDEIR